MSARGVTRLSPGLLRFGAPAAVQVRRGRGVVFVDRDGVLNELVADRRTGMCESPLEEDAVRLVPGAAQALARLVDAGLVPVCVTNQPAAAKGTIPVEQLLAVHLRVVELLAGQGGVLAVSYLCLHHPLGVTPELAGACACRKPAPGMLLQAAGELDVQLRDAWMVGDTDADVGAGRAAGCRTALIRYPGSFHKRALGSGADATFANVSEAVAALSSIKTN